MSYLKIMDCSMYLPKIEVDNEQLEKRLKLEEGYILKRTGILKRYYIDNEDIKYMAENVANKVINKIKNKNDIDLIIVATTTTEYLMPGISNYVQKSLEIENCICLDILAGCAGYINAFDIAQMYISSRNVKKALIIGIDVLSKYTDKTDIGTSIVLSDGAGCVLVEKVENEKKYFSNIVSEPDKNNILTCNANMKLQMNGKEVYKYAVTKTVENINELLEKSEETIENIKYIIPHQSNLKIMKAIATRLKVDMNKMYTNIQNYGNTFCASIPIALTQMRENNLLQEGDKVILIGYGGGLNTASILIEI